MLKRKVIFQLSMLIIAFVFSLGIMLSQPAITEADDANEMCPWKWTYVHIPDTGTWAKIFDCDAGSTQWCGCGFAGGYLIAIVTIT